MAKRNILIGASFSIIYFVLNIIILPHYGLSWDYHYHHYAGLYHLGMKVPSYSEDVTIPFSAPDPRLTVEDPFGPFTQIIPSLSQVIFADGLKILPFDLAYNLPMVVFGSIGVLVLFLFLLEAFNFTVAIIGLIALALNPVYFGYLHNNMKDIPNAAAFALSLWLFWRLVKYKNIKSLVLSALAFALAFNIKINSIFIPVINGLYYLFQTKFKFRGIVPAYFFLAPLLALAVWWPFWREPINKLLELPEFYSLNTYNMPVLFFGKILRSGINIPVIYPYAYLLVSTPLSLVFLSIIGLIFSIYSSVRKKYSYLLVLFWFFIPLARYLSPKAGAIDGIRHFMEVLYPLSVFCGIGFYLIFKKFSAKIKITSGIILLLLLSYDIIKYHPYQTSYFNLAIGGINGAQGKFDLDFWGTPQKEAVLWLNLNAPFDSFVHIVMAQSTASVYLRPDLAQNVNKKTIEESDYVILLNRQSFFGIYDVSKMPKEKEEENKIVFSRRINGVPLVWIFRK